MVGVVDRLHQAGPQSILERGPGPFHLRTEIAPVLAGSLNTAALTATKATTAVVLDSRVSLRTKVSLAFDLRDLIVNAPRGAVPDPRVPFDKRGANTDEKLRETRDSVVAAIKDTLTRGFRSSFLIAALFAAVAAIAAALLGVTRTAPHNGGALVIAGVVVALVVCLVGAELGAGARTFAERRYVDPCHTPADPFPQGSGIDGTLQRISLSAIDGAACHLGTSREELILSLDHRGAFGPKVKWTKRTLEDALRAGLVQAIDDADHRNTIPGFVATALKFVAKRAPIDWVLGRVNIPFLEN